MSNLSIFPEENVGFGVDMVKVELVNVKPVWFNNFMVAVEFLREKIWVGQKITEYRYNAVFQDDLLNPSDTTIFVGYEHNAAVARDCNGKKSMQIRFNPAKLNPDGRFWRELQRLIRYCSYKVLLKEIDLAFDMPYALPDIYIISRTGKEKSMYKGTEYYGQRHSEGYLKKYDKAKEQKQAGLLTRVEVTLKDSIDGTEMLFADLIRPELDKYYNVSVLRSLYGQTGGNSANVNLKAVALGIIHGYLDRSELPEKRKKQVNDYIQENYAVISLDKIIAEKWRSELVRVKSFLFEEIFLVEKEGKRK